MEKMRQYMVRKIIQDQPFVQGFFRRIKYKYIIFTIFSFLVVFLSAGLIFAESDDALFIDGNGNVTVGKTLKAEKFEGEGSALTVGDVEFSEQAKGSTPPTLEEIVRAMILPIGTIMAYAGDVTDQKIKKKLEDQGWLACDGSPIDMDAYKELYDTIENACQSEEEKKKGQFRIPDMRGRFLRGVDYKKENEQREYRDPSFDNRKHPISGEEVGGIVGSVQADGFANHAHSLERNQGQCEQKTGGANAGKWGCSNAQTKFEGGNETRPKNIYVNWIIKAKHIIRTRQ